MGYSNQEDAYYEIIEKTIRLILGSNLLRKSSMMKDSRLWERDLKIVRGIDRRIELKPMRSAKKYEANKISKMLRLACGISFLFVGKCFAGYAKNITPINFNDGTSQTTAFTVPVSSLSVVVTAGNCINCISTINAQGQITAFSSGSAAGGSGSNIYPTTGTANIKFGTSVSTLDVTGSIAINDFISPHSYEISFGTAPSIGFSNHTIGAEPGPSLLNVGVAGSSITIQAGAGGFNTGNTHNVGPPGGNLYLNAGNAGNGGSLSTAANGGSVFIVAGASGTIGNAAGVPGKIVFGSNVESTQASLPAVSSCGTGSPTVTALSTDRSGSVTTGTAATACTITFGPGFTNAPNCQVTGSSLISFPGVTTRSATSVTFGISGAVTADILYWSCEANQ